MPATRTACARCWRASSATCPSRPSRTTWPSRWRPWPAPPAGRSDRRPRANIRARVTLQTVAVIGSGLMGRGIAYCAAAGGFRTALHDVSAEALDRAFVRIRQDLDEGVSRGKLSPENAAAAQDRLALEREFETAVRDADYVIEAVPEDIKLKLATFSRLDALCADEVVLATNTSALSVTEIAAATRRPQRVLGMHFFNPVPKMKLVEIVRALDTGDAA